MSADGHGRGPCVEASEPFSAMCRPCLRSRARSVEAYRGREDCREHEPYASISPPLYQSIIIYMYAMCILYTELCTRLSSKLQISLCMPVPSYVEGTPDSHPNVNSGTAHLAHDSRFTPSKVRNSVITAAVITADASNHKGLGRKSAQISLAASPKLSSNPRLLCIAVTSPLQTEASH